jgi:hypothetical protein
MLAYRRYTTFIQEKSLTNAQNIRLITLMTYLEKLFTGILNERVKTIMLINKIQNVLITGFREGLLTIGLFFA